MPPTPRRQWSILVVCLLAAVAAAVAWPALNRPPAPLTLANGAHLEWVDCWFPVSYFRPVHCGRFTTGREAGQASPAFELPVLYIPARPWRREPTPVLYIAGGPGGATELDARSLPGWLAWIDEVDWPHDLVLYDQRGVGLGRPVLDCPELLAERRSLLPLAADTPSVGRRLQSAAESCKARLQAQGWDLGRFSTPANARDALDLMAVLGAPRWDVYGVSYGTRVALTLERMAPQRLRAVVLDSVYPPEVQAELADPWLLTRTFDLVARACELLEECRRTPAEVREDLNAVLTHLEHGFLEARVADPDGGAPLLVRYNAEDFAWLLFETLYRWDQIAGLPGQLRVLAQGTLPPGLEGLMADSVAAALDTTFSDAVGGAVDCNDATAVGAGSAAAMRARYPGVAALTRHDWTYHPCRTWKVTDIGDAARAPVVAAVPTLLMAGEFDPVTPPEWAEAVAARLPNGYLFQFPGIGHGVLDSHECALALVRAFLAAPEAPATPACVTDL